MRNRLIFSSLQHEIVNTYFEYQATPFARSIGLISLHRFLWFAFCSHLAAARVDSCYHSAMFVCLSVHLPMDPPPHPHDQCVWLIELIEVNIFANVMYAQILQNVDQNGCQRFKMTHSRALCHTNKDFRATHREGKTGKCVKMLATFGGHFDQQRKMRKLSSILVSSWFENRCCEACLHYLKTTFRVFFLAQMGNDLRRRQWRETRKCSQQQKWNFSELFRDPIARSERAVRFSLSCSWIYELQSKISPCELDCKEH